MSLDVNADVVKMSQQHQPADFSNHDQTQFIQIKTLNPIFQATWAV